MRKLILTSFKWKTGDLEFEDKRLVVVTVKPESKGNDMHTDDAQWQAIRNLEKWFPKRYPESELIGVWAHPTIDDETDDSEDEKPLFISKEKAIEFGLALLKDFDGAEHPKRFVGTQFEVWYEKQQLNIKENIKDI